MLESSCRLDVWTHLEPRLRQNTAIDSDQQAAADLTTDVIRVVGSDSLSTSLYGDPITVAASDRAAGTPTSSRSVRFERTAHD
jgi:hypothetical protein